MRVCVSVVSDSELTSAFRPPVVQPLFSLKLLCLPVPRPLVRWWRRPNHALIDSKRTSEPSATPTPMKEEEEEEEENKEEEERSEQCRYSAPAGETGDAVGKHDSAWTSQSRVRQDRANSDEHVRINGVTVSHSA